MAASSLVKSALLIGPTYDHLPQIEVRLKGTLNDVALMKDIISKPPFEFQYIKEVTGSNATYSNILKSFAEICDQAPSNSVVLIYYSGHGYSVKSQEELHYDEGLVPVDANHGNIDRLCITGEILTEHLEKLADKSVATTVIFDCCFSGHMYRSADCDDPNSCFKITAVKQVDFGLSSRGPEPTENDDFSYSYPVQETFIEKWQKEGWRPTDLDKFVFLSACNSQERAYEMRCKQTGKSFGLLTYILANILKALEGKEISYEVLFSLIRRDFLQRNIELQSPKLITKQTPQLEGGQFGTVVFDVKKVELRPKTIMISKVLVISKLVEMKAGRLQLMEDGEYDVFEADVLKADLESHSTHWVGTIDVNQGDIGTTTSKGCITDEKIPDAIKPGCVVRLAKPGSMRRDIVILGSGDSAEKMKSEVEKTKMFNVLEQKESDTDYILKIESVKGEKCWCARHWGQITVPPVYPGEEALMAENMAKDARYKMVRQLTLSDNSHKLHSVSLKIVRIESVEPFGAFTKYKLIDLALNNNDDLYEADALGPRVPTFRAHEAVQTEVDGNKKTRLVDRSGDGLVVQVTNEERCTIHICILFLQLDGSIVALYPKRKGHTIELLKDGSAKEMIRLYIPTDSLRLYCEPDSTKDEPNAGIDVIMLLAATESCEFEPLLQSAIVFGGAKGKEKGREGEKARCQQLNPLEQFRKALCCRGEESLDGSTPRQWLVMKRSFFLQKNK